MGKRVDQKHGKRTVLEKKLTMQGKLQKQGHLKDSEVKSRARAAGNRAVKRVFRHAEGNSMLGAIGGADLTVYSSVFFRHAPGIQHGWQSVLEKKWAPQWWGLGYAAVCPLQCKILC